MFWGGVGGGICSQHIKSTSTEMDQDLLASKSAILATVSRYLNHSHVCGIIVLYINLPFKILIFNYKFQISQVLLYIKNNHHLCSHPYKESEDTVNK